MLGEAQVDLFPLFLRKRAPRCFRSDTVPEVLNKLKPFGHAQAQEVGNRNCHDTILPGRSVTDKRVTDGVLSQEYPG